MVIPLFRHFHAWFCLRWCLFSQRDIHYLGNLKGILCVFFFAWLLKQILACDQDIESLILRLQICLRWLQLQASTVGATRLPLFLFLSLSLSLLLFCLAFLNCCLGSQSILVCTSDDPMASSFPFKSDNQRNKTLGKTVETAWLF